MKGILRLALNSISSYKDRIVTNLKHKPDVLQLFVQLFPQIVLTI